jgi:Domain of unknown function (DUF5348)
MLFGDARGNQTVGHGFARRVHVALGETHAPLAVHGCEVHLTGGRRWQPDVTSLSNRRWAIVRRGRPLYELTSGDVFSVEVDGKLVTTRMEFAHSRLMGGEYYSADGQELRSGMRAAIGAED